MNKLSVEFRDIETWIFDLDNTLYHSSINLFGQIDKRMCDYVSEFLKIPAYEAYKVQKLQDGKERTVLSLKPHLSPIKAAVIPLKKNNEDLVSAAASLKGELQGLGLGRVLLENSGNIGKSYRRHDEVGTPLCITLDFQTLEDQTVTVRNRDSMEQERIHQKETAAYLQEILK